MDADAPSSMKINENPHTKRRVAVNTLALMDSPRSSVRSSMEQPQINEKYDGISGSTQGEKKDKSPARKAAGKETVSTNMPHSLDAGTFVGTLFSESVSAGI